MPIRVLLIAEAANPEQVSVPLEGWSHSRALADLPEVEAHVVTQIRNREAFERAGLVAGRDFTAIDTESVARPLWKVSELLRGGPGKGWTTVAAFKAVAYYAFERRLWRTFRHRIRAGEFDVVHRLTPLSPTTPSLLARSCRKANVPFVMGPLNGGVPWPKGFDTERRREKEWLSYLRGAHRLLPGYGSTRRNAAALIIGSQDTLRLEPERYRHKCVYIPENAIDPSRFTLEVPPRTGLPLKLAFVGRLVPYKGTDMLIEAAAPLIREGKVQLNVLGDGPEMPRLRSLAASLPTEGISLAGWVPHKELQDRLIEADVFAFPSVREFGGAVVLEAMSLGLAPLIVDYGGPGELVTETTGFKIPIGSRGEIVSSLRARLLELASDPEGTRAVGRRARIRVLEAFTWPAKARQVLEVYHWVLGSGPKPDFQARLDSA